MVELQTRRDKQGIIRESTKWGKKYFPHKTVKYKKFNFSNFEKQDEDIDHSLDQDSNPDASNEEENFSERSIENIQDFQSFEWIKWHNNSCRYDVFLTVFCLSLLNKHPDLFTQKTFIRNCS